MLAFTFGVNAHFLEVVKAALFYISTHSLTHLVRGADSVPWGRDCPPASKLGSDARDPVHFVCKKFKYFIDDKLLSALRLHDIEDYMPRSSRPCCTSSDFQDYGLVGQ